MRWIHQSHQQNGLGRKRPSRSSSSCPLTLASAGGSPFVSGHWGWFMCWLNACLIVYISSHPAVQHFSGHTSILLMHLLWLMLFRAADMQWGVGMSLPFNYHNMLFHGIYWAFAWNLLLLLIVTIPSSLFLLLFHQREVWIKPPKKQPKYVRNSSCRRPQPRIFNSCLLYFLLFLLMDTF